MSSRFGPGTAGRDTVPPAGRPESLRIGPWVLAGFGLCAALLAYLTELPCRLATWEQPEAFRRLCYPDLPTLYVSRGMAEGRFPCLDASALLEYPVLQTVVASATGLLAHTVDPLASVYAEQDIYGDVNAVLLAAVWVAVVLLLGRMVAHPGHAVLIGLAPAEDAYFMAVALHTLTVGYLVVRVALDALRGRRDTP